MCKYGIGLCVWIYDHVYLHVYQQQAYDVYICTHACMYLDIRTTCMFFSSSIHVCLCISEYTYITSVRCMYQRRCMYLDIRNCTCICVLKFMWVYVYPNIHLRLKCENIFFPCFARLYDTCVYMYMYMYMRIYMYIYIVVHTYVHICTYMYTCTCMCACYTKEEHSCRMNTFMYMYM